MEFDGIVDVLKEIRDNPFLRKARITEFQQAVWREEIQLASKEVLSILQDLALDLDYFEPNPVFRNEDRAYFGQERLQEEITIALKRIEDLNRSSG